MHTLESAREFLEAGRFDECAALCRALIVGDCGDPLSHALLCRSLAAQGRFDAALAAITDALRLSPADPGLNLDRAFTLLKAGHLQEGWAAYEWRHRQPGAGQPPTLPKVRYLDDLDGRTILIDHEQGFGDTIQFLRYVRPLAEAGVNILLRVPRELARLMRGQAGIAAVLVSGQEAAPADYYCPANSLPYIFDTSLETVPTDGAYISADTSLIAEWAARLPPGPRVGLVWAGDASPGNPGLERRRNVPFKMLLPLTVTPAPAFVSLQTGPARDKIAGPIHDPMGAVQDFADTAAIIANLDAVISVDTAVAHLAAAMGKPVFLLDRYDNCWRWLHGRGDSPWYPTLMIFRQTEPGDWLGPVTEAAQTLEEFFPEG